VTFFLVGAFQFAPFSTPEDVLLARFRALSPTTASDEELANIVLGIQENAESERAWRRLAGWTTLALAGVLGVVAFAYAIVAQSPTETTQDRLNRQETALQEATFAATMGLFAAVHLARPSPAEQALTEVDAAQGVPAHASKGADTLGSLRVSLGATRTGGPAAFLTGRF
jgi:hypothetical protein